MRSIKTKQLLNKEVTNTIKIDDHKLASAIGDAEVTGIWLLYGAEKNGKTWTALTLAKALCVQQKVAYVSAEEGTDKSFIDAVKRAGITSADKIDWYDYMPLPDLLAKFSRRNTGDVIVIDNCTIYQSEMKASEIKRFESQLSGKLVILIAHEERREPYGALGKMAKKMAKVYIHVKGLQAFIVSRFGVGGELLITQKKGKMFWG